MVSSLGILPNQIARRYSIKKVFREFWNFHRTPFSQNASKDCFCIIFGANIYLPNSLFSEKQWVKWEPCNKWDDDLVHM